MKWVLVVLLVFCVGCAPQETTDTMQEVETMKLTSVFEHNDTIPSKYTCDGENVNPELTLTEVPREAVSVVILMDDPDIPQEVKEKVSIEVFDHWVVFNIPIIIPESSSGLPEHEPSWDGVVKIAEGNTAGTNGANSRGENVYTGPCPPAQYEPKEHRYFFKENFE
jgi:Raf kinase inhibitor-like YbhB/YbcL family protein